MHIRWSCLPKRWPQPKSKLRKLNKIKFCYKSCRICHLGKLPAIIIDVLKDSVHRKLRFRFGGKYKSKSEEPMVLVFCVG